MTKEDLKEYRWIVDNVKALESEIQDLRDKIDVRSPLWSDMPGCKAEGDKMATVVSQIVDSRDRLILELRKAMTKRVEIESAIEKLPEREKALIRYRYIQGKSWEQICLTMNYEWRQVHRIHSGALKMINAS